MFTGLVEEVGDVASLVPTGDGIEVRINASTVTTDIEIGASIAVNGVCLTVVAFDDTSLTAQAVPETMERSNLGHRHSLTCDHSSLSSSRYEHKANYSPHHAAVGLVRATLFSDSCRLVLLGAWVFCRTPL